MSEGKSKFIGNSSLSSVLYHEYQKGFSNYSSGEMEVTANPEEIANLREIRQSMEEDALTMANGIEAIGHLLASVDQDNKGLPDSQLEWVGFLLAHLGKQVGSHQYDVTNLTFMLDHVKR